jgi:hypothetical protein
LAFAQVALLATCRLRSSVLAPAEWPTR